METLSLSEGSVNSKSSEKISGGDFLPRFSVCERLAGGGTSELYLARDTFVASAHVVLKCVHQSILQSRSTREIASRELSIARQLSHPNLIEIYDLYRKKSVECLVMEYLAGSSLKGLLSRRRPNNSLAIAIFGPLVDVVEYLHRQGVVHSDIKPSNIMITRDNKVKLIDLANCRTDSNNPSPSVIISNDHFYGYSLDYSSPQVISDQPATTSDDVFSLACVLYELHEGRPPPITVAGKAQSMSITSVKKPASLNYWQWLVLKKGMAADSNQRYQSARSFYRRFVFAKHSLAIFLCSVLLLSVLGFIGFKLGQSDGLYGEELIDHVDSQQQGEIGGVVDLIRSQPPADRYKWLYRLEPFSDLLQQGALSLLYGDVVDPVVGFVEMSISRPSGTPDFDMLHDIVGATSIFYPYSKDLDRIKRLLFNEQQVFIENLTFRLSNIASGGEYDLAKSREVATIFEKLATLGVSSRAALLDEEYTEHYASLVYGYAESGKWGDLHKAYQFAEAVDSYLSEFKQAWRNADGKRLNDSRLLAEYIVHPSSGLNYPEKAVERLLREKIAAMRQDIAVAWRNEYLVNHVDALLLLKEQYQIPNDVAFYGEISGALAKRIKQKIDYHSARKQRLPVNTLAGLLDRLTK